MLVYEVSLDVDAAVAADYAAWLHEHIAAMLALPGFVGAQLWRQEEPAVAGRCAWVVAYRLHDRAALEGYLAEHAPRMREDGQRRFGGRFSAQRRVLHAEPLAGQ